MFEKVNPIVGRVFHLGVGLARHDIGLGAARGQVSMDGSRPVRLNNRGGGYVENVQTSAVADGGHRLCFRGPAGAVKQISLTDPRYTIDRPVADHGHQFLRSSARMPTRATRSLLSVLGEVLTLPTAGNVNFAVALDWYKTPIENVSPYNWPKTAVAGLVHRGKYWYIKNSQIEQQRECGLALVDQLRAVINQHPLLSNIDAIADVPGHDSKRVSFGSRLAAAVAKHLDKPLIRCLGLAEFRTEAKSLDPAALAAMIDNQFVCHADLNGESLLIIDDVYRSGITIAETARALHAAGGAHVASLCAVRTMRSS